MTARRLLPVVLLVLVAAAGIFFFYPDGEPDNEPVALDPGSDLEREPAVTLDPGETPVFEPVVLDPSRPLVMRGTSEPEDVASGTRGVPVSFGGLENVDVGGRFTFVIPQEQATYEGRVTDVQVTASGNRVISGFSEPLSDENDNAKSHRFLITVGEEQAFATIQTSVSRYQMDTRQGFGRLVNVVELSTDKDYSIPDFVIPREVEPPADLLEGSSDEGNSP